MMSLISKPMILSSMVNILTHTEKIFGAYCWGGNIKSYKSDTEVKLNSTFYGYVLIGKLIKFSEPQCLHL